MAPSSTPTQIEPVIGTVEAAKILNLEPETLERWRPLRRGPRFIKIGRKIGYRRGDLEAFLNQQTVETTTR